MRPEQVEFWLSMVQRGCVLVRALRGQEQESTHDHARELERAEKVRSAVCAAEKWAKGQR